MIHDVAIIGGGLAGLSAAIQLAQTGKTVVLFEKNTYPFMRVCGEYISLESWNFIESLGVNLKELNLPILKKLEITSPIGTDIKQENWLGGFGISRYLLDYELYKIAKSLKVKIFESTVVKKIDFQNDSFLINTESETFQSKVCIGSFGKRSNIDIALKRGFLNEKNTRLNNYLGVKYHIKIDFPKDKIVLHNFKDGYCGMSAIENDKYCLCYLTKASNLKVSKNDIKVMEREILSRNPNLKYIFKNAQFVDSQPIVISQVSFEKKETVLHHILMIGDSAGMITPLCGNGMTMAMHSSKIVFTLISDFLNDKITRGELEKKYTQSWNIEFDSRLKTGRLIQSFFGNISTTEILIKLLKPFPALVRLLLRKTHGQGF